MKRVCVLVALVVVLVLLPAMVGSRSSVASAKNGTPSTITVAVNGLTCSTSLGGGTFLGNSYSFGASQSSDITSGGGGGAGKATISDLSVARAMDACSPALFGAVLTGKHFTSTTLVQTDANGNTLLTITLSDALVSSYNISGNQQNPSPSETISFAFRKICVEEASSGSKFCFDFAENKTF
jgi:type VI protein secretion system component Hcp